MVLLHGWPQNWYCWRRLVPLLEGRRLIMPDLRGHGWSEAPRHGYEKEQLVDDLLALIDRLELDTVGLIGHDWGGWTGFLASLRRAGPVHAACWRWGSSTLFSTPRLPKQCKRGAAPINSACRAPPFQLAMRASPRFIAGAISAATVRSDAHTDADRTLYGEVFRDPARARATTQLYRTFLLRELPGLQRYQTQRLTVSTNLLIGDRDPIGSPAMLDGMGTTRRRNDRRGGDISWPLPSRGGPPRSGRRRRRTLRASRRPTPSSQAVVKVDRPASCSISVAAATTMSTTPGGHFPYRSASIVIERPSSNSVQILITCSSASAKAISEP